MFAFLILYLWDYFFEVIENSNISNWNATQSNNSIVQCDKMLLNDEERVLNFQDGMILRK